MASNSSSASAGRGGSIIRDGDGGTASCPTPGAEGAGPGSAGRSAVATAGARGAAGFPVTGRPASDEAAPCRCLSGPGPHRPGLCAEYEDYCFATEDVGNRLGSLSIAVGATAPLRRQVSSDKK